MTFLYSLETLWCSLKPFKVISIADRPGCCPDAASLQFPF